MGDIRRQTYKNVGGTLQDQLLSYEDIQEQYDLIEDEILGDRDIIIKNGKGITKNWSAYIDGDPTIVGIVGDYFYYDNSLVEISAGLYEWDVSALANGNWYVHIYYTNEITERAVAQDRKCAIGDKYHRYTTPTMAVLIDNNTSHASYITVCGATVSSGEATVLLVDPATDASDYIEIDNMNIDIDNVLDSASYVRIVKSEGDLLNNRTAGNARKVLIHGGSGVKSWSNISRGYTFVVAASDSDTYGKAVADYVCDGTADESEINTAITAASAFTGGGTVKLLAGTYYLADKVSAANNVNIKGQGKYNTTLKKATTYDADVILIQCRSVDYITISDLALDGLKADGSNSGTHNLIEVKDSDYVTIDNCYIYDSYTIGLKILDGSTNCVVRNCDITGCTDDGVFITDSGTNYTKILNNNIYSNGDYGVYTVNDSYTHLSGNHIYSNTDNGIRNTGTGINHIICNNMVTGNGTTGLYCGVAHSVITGNNFDANGTGTGGCIILDAASCVVTGNSCYISGGSSHMIEVIGNYNNLQGNRVSEGITISAGSGNLPAATQTSTSMTNSSNVIIND